MYPLPSQYNPQSIAPNPIATAASVQGAPAQGMSQTSAPIGTGHLPTNLPSYAHGGHPTHHMKRGKLIQAHFNKGELDILDHLQGKTEKCPRSGMKSYTSLEEILKNPHILSRVHHHTRDHHHHTRYHHKREHHAHGGHAGHHNNHHGVHGDTELALIGPHLHEVLKDLHFAVGGHPHDLVNPYDGKPQFWSLGSALHGLYQGVKGAGTSALHGIGHVGKALTPIGTMIGGQMLGGALAAAPALTGFGAAAAPLGYGLGLAGAGMLGGAADKAFNWMEHVGDPENPMNPQTRQPMPYNPYGDQSEEDPQYGPATYAQSDLDYT